MNIIDVYCADENSCYNKELTDFLKRNIKHIIQKGKLALRFNIIKLEKVSETKNALKVTSLPAIKIHNKAYCDMNNIITIINKSINKTISQEENTSLEDYNKKILLESIEIKNGILINNEKEEEGFNLEKRKKEYEEERKKYGMESLSSEVKNLSNNAVPSQKEEPKTKMRSLEQEQDAMMERALFMNMSDSY